MSELLLMGGVVNLTRPVQKLYPIEVHAGTKRRYERQTELVYKPHARS